jgi:hypothetical protein
MTALADISKAAAAMYGDALRGSDLAAFNAEHKRDAQGRFAAMAAAPAQTDPRSARQARMKRRARRGAKAGQIRAIASAAEAQQAKEEEKSTLGALLALRRPRTRAEAQPRLRTRTQTQAKPRAVGKPALDDEAYMAAKGKAFAIRPTDTIVVVSAEQAEEFLSTGKLVVGAANDRWNTTLAGQQVTQATVPTSADLSGTVALRMRNPHFVNVNDKGETDGSLAAAQVLRPWGDDKSPGPVGGRKGFTGILGFDKQSGKQTDDPARMGSTMKVIDVNAYNKTEWNWWASRTVPFAKADETWEEDEHRRDPRSGRFMALAAAAPTVLERDPRVARDQRAQRRRRRAIRAHPAQGAAPAEAEPELAVLRERAARHRTAVRADPRTRTQSARRPLARPNPRRAADLQAVGEPPSSPPPRPGRLVYGGEGAGGRIVSPEEYDAIQRAANRERVSRYTPSRPLRVRRTETVEPEVETFTRRLVESEKLAATQPRFIYDEQGVLVNLAEIRAYAKAKRASGSRKPSA